MRGSKTPTGMWQRNGCRLRVDWGDDGDTPTCIGRAAEEWTTSDTSTALKKSLIKDRIRPLGFDEVSNIPDLGGTILGSSNNADRARYCVGCGMDGSLICEDVTDRVIEHARDHRLDLLVCIGGDGTMSGAWPLIQRGLRIVGVPKTIDNDLMHTEITFGFDTAVTIARDALDRMRTSAASHHRVMLVEVMGRNAGWLTLHAAAASGADIVLIPDIEYDLEAICARCVERSKHHKDYTIIAVAEGAKPRGGTVMVDHVVHESPDPVRLGGVSETLCEQIAERPNLECLATILGHVQRGGRPSAHDRVLGTRFGLYFIKMILKDTFNRMAAMQAGELTSVSISEVADQQRLVPVSDALVAVLRATGVSFGEPS